MKAIVMKEFGGPEVLKYVDVPDPVPEANEVLIKLAFCGVNPNETYVRTGTYNFYKPELPYTPGYDGAGVIEKVGAGVTHVKSRRPRFRCSSVGKTQYWYLCAESRLRC